MLHASAKKKGQLLQNMVGKALAFVTGLRLDDFATARTGKFEADVRLSAEARRRWPLHVECKNTRKLAFAEWWKQASSDATRDETGLPPCLVFKLHGHSEPFIALQLGTFLDLLFGPFTIDQRATLKTIWRAPTLPKEPK